MSEQKISDIMETTMEKIKTMVDANTIIGDRIVVDDITIIPISKLSFGFASGASDFAGKNNGSKVFAGGGGAGASVQPVGFLVVTPDGKVDMLNVNYEPKDPLSQIVGFIENSPELIQKFKDLFAGKKMKEE